MRIHLVHTDVPRERDRIVPRLARLLVSATGWTIGPTLDPDADLNYAFPYLEARRWKPDVRFAGWFTHREDILPAKAKLWDKQAQLAALRITTAEQYAPELLECGPTVVIAPPLDRKTFSPRERAEHTTLRAGVSGYSYAGGRKGETVLRDALPLVHDLDWSAIGRGWPIKTKRIAHRELPEWYASLDMYVCPSLIEGIPYGPLEALACGVPVVIPRGVGLLDELPAIDGIVRYDCGEAEDMARAIEELRGVIRERDFNRDALRSTTERFTEDGWITGHLEAFASLERSQSAPAPAVEGNKGVYVVAYGKPARACAERLIASIRLHLPGVPVAVASEEAVPSADVTVAAPDVDLGGRAAKTQMWELAPAQWERVLYLDADIELKADVSFLFDALAAGWEMVCTKDVNGINEDGKRQDYDLIHSLWRRDSQEHDLGWDAIGSDRALQLAGGVVGFRRCENTERFLGAWFEEWHRLARRDQGAMIRAMYAHPVRLLVLGNEWNSFERIFRGKSAGVLHHRGGPARRIARWGPGRLDDKAAWENQLNGRAHMTAGRKKSHAERNPTLSGRKAFVTYRGASRVRRATGLGRRLYTFHGDRPELVHVEDIEAVTAGATIWEVDMNCPMCDTAEHGCTGHGGGDGAKVSGLQPNPERPVYVRQRASTGVAGYKGDVTIIEPEDLKRRGGADNKKRKTVAGNKGR